MLEETRWPRAAGPACPLCGGATQMRMRTKAGETWHDLYRCRSCSSGIFHPFTVPDYKDEIAATDRGSDRSELTVELSIQCYLDYGAGIQQMFLPLLALPEGQHAKSLLEVGGGFCFALGFAAWRWGMEVQGVEPSEIGDRGARALGVPVARAYLDDDLVLPRPRYDVVYSSEVIEHVEDPRGFVAALKGRLAKDGTLVLTTPRVTFLDEDQSEDWKVEVMSAPLHHILFSPRALESMLLGLGFAHVQVLERRERLFAYASDAPLDIEVPRHEECTVHYIDYLTYLTGQLGGNRARVGILYRLLTEYSNLGRLDEAEQTWHLLVAEVERVHGAGALEPETVLAHVRSTKFVQDLSKVMPLCTAAALYHRALALMNRHGDFAGAEEHLRAADAVNAWLLRRADWHKDAGRMHWPTRLQWGMSRLYQGDHEGADELFSQVATAYRSGTRPLVEPSTLVESLLRAGMNHARAGDERQARRALKEARAVGKRTLAAPGFVQEAEGLLLQLQPRRRATAP